MPYWMPRFYPREVPAFVTEKTGIKFASVDWQPCGHKDITICHAESHYDFHLYYKTPEELKARMPTCEIGETRRRAQRAHTHIHTYTRTHSRTGSPSNTNLPVCRDSATNWDNHAYFRLLSKSGNMPERTHSITGRCGASQSSLLRSPPR